MYTPFAPGYICSSPSLKYSTNQYEYGSCEAFHIDSDTFEAKLLTICGGEVVAIFTTSVLNASNGKIKLVLDDSVVKTLKTENGDRADYCYSKPLYKLVIDCDTVNNGKFVAKINKVYVE